LTVLLVVRLSIEERLLANGTEQTEIQTAALPASNQAQCSLLLLLQVL
jgi:hypothetical protein